MSLTRDPSTALVYKIPPAWTDWLSWACNTHWGCVCARVDNHHPCCPHSDRCPLHSLPKCPSAQVPPKPYRLKGFGQKQATSEITKSYPLEIWRKLGRNRLMLLANYCLCNIWSKKRVKSTRKLFHKKHWVKAISVDTKYPILSKYKEFCWRKQCTVHMLVNEAGCIRWPPPPLPLPMGVM